MVANAKEYLVSHGKTGVLGRFLAGIVEPLRRGDRVVIQGDRGLTLGFVLCEATERQTRLLGPGPVGRLLRRADASDDSAHSAVQEREQRVFEIVRRLAAELGVSIEILDVELALDGRHVILQYLAGGDCDPTGLADRLSADEGLEVWLENLAVPPAQEDHEHAGCGKPDCGKSEGGCSTCGSGGCSSCGTGKVDMTAYFAHLRGKLAEHRTPLL